MRKPHGVLFTVDEKPPTGVIVLSALQHVAVMSIFLVYPVLIGREAGADASLVANLVSISLMVLAVGTVLQALPRGPLGSGYLCQPVPTAIYLIPSLLAARAGGLPLVFGMTIAAGALEMALSRALRALRPLFPPEVAGLVVALIGVTTGVVAIRIAAGVGFERTTDGKDLAVAAATLTTMVALNVWTRGALRLSCVLIGMVVGYAFAAKLGIVGPAEWKLLQDAVWLSFPRFDHLGWRFDSSLVVPFSVAVVAAVLKTTGNVITSQKLNDADWVRPDMPSIGRGVLADGLATTLAGVAGTSGVNSASGNVGVASATGVLSRRVAYFVAACLLALALFPKLGLLFFLMPGAVAGMSLLFVAVFIFVNGLEIMASRLLDARRTFVIGLSFMASLAVDLVPQAFEGAPSWVQPLFVSSLVLGPVSALMLNGLFRLGVRRVQRLSVDPRDPDYPAIGQFIEVQGAAWGARRDVIDRASFNLAQSIETVVGACEPQSDIEVEAAFDEFNLDIRISYEGPSIELPSQRPSNEEIMASEEGQRKLAGFLLRRYADRVAASYRSGRSTLLFHFDH